MEGADRRMVLSHLRRESRTALELAVLLLAPSLLIDRLALAAGLLEALSELPSDSAPVIALFQKAVTRAKSSLKDWQSWHDGQAGKRSARS